MASVAVHAAVLAGLFLQEPLPTMGARESTVSVELETMIPAPAPTRPPAAHTRKPAPAHARRARERMRERPQVPARAVAGLTRQAESAHTPKPAARAKPVKATSPADDAAASSTPTATADASARETNLVRQHLERFKFYPLSARRRGIGGDVEVGFCLTAGGRAEQVRVLASSGYDILDEAALQTVSRAQPFPVNDGQYRVRLRFRSL